MRKRWRLSELRAERLLPFACLAGAALLIASEFMDTFHFNGTDEATGVTTAVAAVSDRHHHALVLLGALAVFGLLAALWSGSRPAALSVFAAGVAALFIFLLIDLPDAGRVGTFTDPTQSFIEAKAIPQAGFWLELIGALVLTVCGGALATLSPAQLRGLAPRRADRGEAGELGPSGLPKASEEAGGG
ncbi:MAG: hypothetical protein U0R52_03340 [Solirubrobacterales bacterium]